MRALRWLLAMAALTGVTTGLRRRRLLPVAVGFGAAALAASCHPTGLVALGPFLVALPVGAIVVPSVGAAVAMLAAEMSSAAASSWCVGVLPLPGVSPNGRRTAVPPPAAGASVAAPPRRVNVASPAAGSLLDRAVPASGRVPVQADSADVPSGSAAPVPPASGCGRTRRRDVRLRNPGLTVERDDEERRPRPEHADGGHADAARVGHVSDPPPRRHPGCTRCAGPRSRASVRA